MAIIHILELEYVLYVERAVLMIIGGHVPIQHINKHVVYVEKWRNQVHIHIKIVFVIRANINVPIHQKKMANVLNAVIVRIAVLGGPKQILVIQRCVEDVIRK